MAAARRASARAKSASSSSRPKLIWSESSRSPLLRRTSGLAKQNATAASACRDRTHTLGSCMHRSSSRAELQFRFRCFCNGPLCNPTGITTVRLDRHSGEGRFDVTRLEQHRLESCYMQTVVKPMRQGGSLHRPTRMIVTPRPRRKAASASGSLATCASRMTLPAASSTHRLLNSGDVSIPTWCSTTALLMDGPEPLGPALNHHSGRDPYGPLRHLPDPLLLTSEVSRVPRAPREARPSR